MSIKILNLLPVVSDIWTSDMSDYVEKLLLPDTTVVTEHLDHGPASIEGEYDEIMASPEIIFRVKQAEKDGFDAVFVDCFADPAVRAARECVKIPVFGGFEPAVLYSLGVADKIGVITVLPEVVPMLRGLIAKEGLKDRVTSLRYVNIPVLSLEDFKTLVAGLIEEGIKAIEEDGVEAIVLGCTAMVGVKEGLEEGLAAKGYNVVVIEAARSALMMCETYARMGLSHSRAAYMSPTEKQRLWWSGDETVDI